jgi:hypothetical protein
MLRRTAVAQESDASWSNHKLMRIGIGLVLMCAGVILLGGPVFGGIGVLSGHEIHVRGGVARILFDLLIGGTLVLLGRQQMRPNELA